MLLIKNGLLHTMETEQPLPADLLIKNGKIAEIAPDIAVTEKMQLLDAAGLHVFPGFIDAHSHIGISEEKVTGIGDECNENTTPATPYLRAVDCIHPMDSAFHNALASGITGIMAGPGSSNPVGGQFAFLKTHGRCIDDMVLLAPAAIKIAFGENPMTCFGMNGNAPSTRMGIAAIIREELFNAKQYLLNTPADSAEKNFRLECYRELFDKKIPLKAHVHRTDDILTAIRIAKEFDLDLTLDHCTEGHLIAEEIARSGYPAIVRGGRLRFPGNSGNPGPKSPAGGGGSAPVRRFRKRGLCEYPLCPGSEPGGNPLPDLQSCTAGIEPLYESPGSPENNGDRWKGGIHRRLQSGGGVF